MVWAVSRAFVSIQGAPNSLRRETRPLPLDPLDEVNLGAALFEVTARKIFDEGEFEKEKATARSGQEAERLNQLLASLIEIRRRDLTPAYGAQGSAHPVSTS